MKIVNFLTALFSVLTLHAGLTADQYVPDWAKNIPGNNGNGSVHYGPTNISNESLEDLTIYGPGTINDSTISKVAMIKGPVKAKNSSFNKLTLDGIANFENVTVNDLDMAGPLFAQNSTVKNASVASVRIGLSNSKIAKLVVRRNERDDRPPEVYLEKGAKIDSLTFESKNGRVILADSSSSVKNLEGGKIQSTEQ
jgi:hypothetical protein